MTEKTFKAGEFVFEIGDEPDFAYLIKEGAVEVLIQGGNGLDVFAEMGPGEVFGEMALVIDKPRPATIRARTDVVVEVYDEPAFEQNVLENPERLRRYLGTLFERLRTASFGNAGLGSETQPPFSVQATGPAANAKEAACIVMEALNEIPGSDNRIEIPCAELPFNIGRASDSLLLVRNDFTIFDQKPYKVSRGHCVIERLADKFAVRDRLSATGTILNGEVLGEHGQRQGAFLKPGPNELILGPPDSLYRFTLTVQ
ncbi:MAG: cyclic nucleotide-binding domain-containing protein [Opitutales bacterium]